jgi:hypothetical protein
MFNVLAKAALVGVLLTAPILPAVAAPTFDDRHEGHDRHGVADDRNVGSSASDHRAWERPDTRPAAISQKPAPKYNGYYGPVVGPSARPKRVLLGIGGWW